MKRRWRIARTALARRMRRWGVDLVALARPMRRWGIIAVAMVTLAGLVIGGIYYLGRDETTEPDDPWRDEVDGRQWRHIVLHHSATAGGNAERFDRFHREQRGWDELAYHFVIDNGQGGPDGLVEVGSRWASQKHGAHTGGTPGDEYNQHGIGICLVGDFTRTGPTRAQLKSLDKLVRRLMAEHDIPASRVIGHGEAPGADSACPGAAFQHYIDTALRPELAGRPR